MMSVILAKLEKNEQTSNKKFIALENMILQSTGSSQEQEQDWDEEEEIEEDGEEEEEEVEFESFSNFIPSQAAGPGNCLQSFSLPSSCPEEPKSKVQAVSLEDFELSEGFFKCNQFEFEYDPPEKTKAKFPLNIVWKDVRSVFRNMDTKHKTSFCDKDESLDPATPQLEISNELLKLPTAKGIKGPISAGGIIESSGSCCFQLVTAKGHEKDFGPYSWVVLNAS
ncbi:unnamed protein product [Rotaria socialis]|uniref:Uncharacterized protein n=1 Tax=Rotaria socialis TaxID=392032 RepID=A0A821THG8_9BILA|nr:unnamed protein product [Rotaria socialis]